MNSLLFEKGKNYLTTQSQSQSVFLEVLTSSIVQVSVQENFLEFYSETNQSRQG